MKRIMRYLIPLLICFAVGFSASLFQKDAIAYWYPYLYKPALTPPNIVFPVVWSILYVCMAVSIGLLLDARTERKGRYAALFAVQLFLNFMWSILFFFLRNPAAGLADILLLDLVLVVYAVKAWPVSKAASVLFWPYMLWGFFATYLNAYILVCN